MINPFSKATPMNTTPAPETSMSTKQQRAFTLARNAARRAIRRRVKVLRLTKDAYAKLGEGDGAMSRVAQDLHAMLRMAKSWARREYTAVPWKVMLYVIAAIIYFVNPIDLIPDVLAGIGFVDDAAVIGAVVRSVHAELLAFRRWEDSHTAEIGPSSARQLSAAA